MIKAFLLLLILTPCAASQSTTVCNTYPGKGDNGGDKILCRTVPDAGGIFGIIQNYREIRARDAFNAMTYARDTFDMAVRLQVLYVNLATFYRIGSRINLSSETSGKFAQLADTWSQYADDQQKINTESATSYLKITKQGADNGAIINQKKSMKRWHDQLLAHLCPLISDTRPSTDKMEIAFKKIQTDQDFSQVYGALHTSMDSFKSECSSDKTIRMLAKGKLK